MDFIFLPLANLVGASVDQVKLIACLLIAYPLGSVFVRVPSSKPALRHLFNIGVALFFFFPMLQLYDAFFRLLATILLTYFTAKYYTSPRMPWVVFVLTMGHLLVNHTIRAINKTSYETIEITGPQMVLTMKLTTFAWNVFDGRRPVEELDQWQLSKRITEFPSLLEFLGYTFYFPGLLIGPSLEYANYDELVKETLFKNGNGNGATKENKKGRRLPSGRKRAAYSKMVMGLIYLGIYVTVGGQYNYTTILTPTFQKLNLPSRILVHQALGFLERSKYYALWILTEGASILTGLGFTGFDPVSGRSLWNGAANLSPRNIEFGPNFKVILDNWNMKTNVWLRECVYKRVTPKGKKPGFRSSMITFATSAIWHGVAVGYYLSFLLGGFITTAGRLARANIRPLLLPGPGEKESFAKKIYDFLGMVLGVSMMNYATVPFMLLTLKDSLDGWRILGYYGHVVIFSSLLFFYAGGARFLKALQKKEGKVAPPRTNGTTTPVPLTVPPPLDEVIPPPES